MFFIALKKMKNCNYSIAWCKNYDYNKLLFMFNFIPLDISARRKMASTLYINIYYYQIMQYTSIVIVWVFMLKTFFKHLFMKVITANVVYKFELESYGWHCSSPVCQQKCFRRATVLQLESYITFTVPVNIIWVGMEHLLISDPIPFSVVPSRGSNHIQVNIR